MPDSPALSRYTCALAAAVLAAASLSAALPLQAQAANTPNEYANNAHDGSGQPLLNADGPVAFIVTKGQKG